MAFSGIAAAYAMLVPLLTKVARAKGYCLAVHGSMSTDLDMVAVPWTEGAAPEAELVAAMREATGTCIHHAELDHYWKDMNPTRKAHGRNAYSLHFTNRGAEGPYLDLSVMPRWDDRGPCEPAKPSPGWRVVEKETPWRDGQGRYIEPGT